MTAAIERTCPAALRRSLTWDQGTEMVRHREITVATRIWTIYFCDPASPWQRGTNENTNGLLRQYFPKGTGLTGYSAEDLEFVADEMNRRPRKTLGLGRPQPKPSPNYSQDPTQTNVLRPLLEFTHGVSGSWCVRRA